MKNNTIKFALSALSLALLSSFGSAQAAGPTTRTVSSTITGTSFVISSRDPVGVGFNDETQVAALPGNAATTLGEQRWAVYLAAGKIWADNLQTAVPITVSAAWEALNCTANSATLGSAGAYTAWYNEGSDFEIPNAPISGLEPRLWYPQALAYKLHGGNLQQEFGYVDDGTGYSHVDIKTQFNVNLGQPNCLAGTFNYLGLDGKPPTGQLNFITTLLHELGHGLGFSALVYNTRTGVNAYGNIPTAGSNYPSVWAKFMFDNSIGKNWVQMTDLERKGSAINNLGLAWTGANSVAGAVTTLAKAPKLTFSGGYVKSIPLGTAGFGPQLTDKPTEGVPAFTSLTGNVVPVVDQANGTGLACFPLRGTAASLVKGKVALVDRGVCGFIVKVKNAQNAGAIAVLVADNVEAPVSGLGGTDSTITIPSARIQLSEANLLKTKLKARVGRAAGTSVNVTFALDPVKKAGSDAMGRPLLYTPATLASGSSVSHWDVSASPDLLMEPFDTGSANTILVPPKDLTIPLLKDIGWTSPPLAP